MAYLRSPILIGDSKREYLSHEPWIHGTFLVWAPLVWCCVTDFSSLTALLDYLVKWRLICSSIQSWDSSICGDWIFLMYIHGIKVFLILRILWITMPNFYDEIIKWKHFPRYWPFVRGIHRSPVNSPHKGLWRGALMFSLICAWINRWVNNREAGDFKCHRAHYDVIAMLHIQIKSETSSVQSDNSA